MTYTTQRQRAMRIAEEKAVFSSGDAARRGVHSQVLTRMVEEGRLERVARGRYRFPGAPLTENHNLALVAGAVPGGVVCLLSALSFHGIGTQVPSRVWIALDRRARKPSQEWPPMRVVRFSGEALTEGVETHTAEGVAVKVYGVAKTLADLFKYRHKLGIDVALEALKEVWRSGHLDVDELLHFARICRVERVMRPYLESVTA